MPYTLKTQQISVKDPDSGEYIGVDVLAEQNKESLIAEIQSEGDLQVERVDQKAAEILAAGDAQVTRINQTGTNVQTLVDQEEARAQQIVTDAQTSLNTLEAQKNTIAETVASMAELGTDTTLTTPGMAADAKAVGDVKSEVDNLGDFVYDQDSGLSTKAPAITDSASSGDIVTFESDVEGGLVSKLTGTIEPIQDLHGYDYPWPGGGGVNKFNKATAIAGTRFSPDGIVSYVGTSRSDYIPCEPNTNYYFMNVHGSGVMAGVFWFDANKQYISYSAQPVPSPTSYAATSPANAAYVGINFRTEDLDTVAINYPSTVTTYSPYSNICPISGYTGCNVVRTGKNLLDDSGIQLLPTQLRIARDEGIGGKPFLLKGGCTYTLSYNSSEPATALYFIRPYTSVSNALAAQFNAKSITYTPIEDIEVGCVMEWANGRPENITHLMLVEGSTAMDYVPYTGSTIPVSFPTEAGTVYSGAIDPISGKLVVDKIDVTLKGTDSWSGNYVGGFFTPKHDMKKVQNYTSTILSDTLPTIVSHGHFSVSTCGISGYADGNNAYPNQNWIYIKIAGVETISDLRTYLEAHPIHVLYELATPIEYQCTPTEVKTLLGTNNIWLDTGTITECVYPKDTKKYIDNKTVIKAPVIINHAEGEIASFTDGAEDMPVKLLAASIEPVQDLHGYENPWPAGGGVNLLSSENISRLSQTSYGVTYVVQEDGSIKATGTVTTQTWNYAAFYTPISTYGLSVGDTISLTCFGDDVNFAIHFYDESTQLGAVDAKMSASPTATIPNGTTRFRVLVYCKASSGPAVGEVINKTFYPQLEKASTPSSIWYPYSNICPISGHTNLYDQSKLERSNITYENGVLTGTAGAFNSHFGQGIPDPPKFKDGQYTFSMEAYTDGDVSTVGAGLVIGFKYIDGTYSLSNFNNSDSQFIKKEITSTLNKQIVSVTIGYNSVGTNTWHVRNIQLEYSSTSTEYEPYTGTTLPITFPTTIYGGSDEVIGGALADDSVKVMLSEFAWRAGSNGLFFAYLNSVQSALIKLPDTLRDCNIMCNKYKAIAYDDRGDDCVIYTTWINSTAGNIIYAVDSRFAELADFTASITDDYIIAKRNTPTECTLTPNELTTLLGTNNIWTDSGSVSVDYSADTKLFIQNAIAEALSNSSNP